MRVRARCIPLLVVSSLAPLHVVWGDGLSVAEQKQLSQLEARERALVSQLSQGPGGGPRAALRPPESSREDKIPDSGQIERSVHLFDGGSSEEYILEMDLGGDQVVLESERSGRSPVRERAEEGARAAQRDTGTPPTGDAAIIEKLDTIQKTLLALLEESRETRSYLKSFGEGIGAHKSTGGGDLQSSSEPVTESKGTTERTAAVLVDNGVARLSPSQYAIRFGLIPRGTVVPVKSWDKVWAEIVTPDGIPAWMERRALDFNP